jgi:hypothetical protein
MFSYIMDVYHKIIKALNIAYVPAAAATGPNCLAELLHQFALPPAPPPTQEVVVTTYQIKETIAAVELDLLKMDPALEYRGCQKWHDMDDNKYFDFVPCVVRPEVLYCSYGKN